MVDLKYGIIVFGFFVNFQGTISLPFFNYTNIIAHTTVFHCILCYKVFCIEVVQYKAA